MLGCARIKTGDLREGSDRFAVLLVAADRAVGKTQGERRVGILPALVSGEIIVSVVLSLPTSGPMLLRSLMSQDMYLAGSLILMVSALTMIGTLFSDILLALVDPRIRYQ